MHGETQFSQAFRHKLSICVKCENSKKEKYHRRPNRRISYSRVAVHPFRPHCTHNSRHEVLILSAKAQSLPNPPSPQDGRMTSLSPVASTWKLILRRREISSTLCEARTGCSRTVSSYQITNKSYYIVLKLPMRLDFFHRQLELNMICVNWNAALKPKSVILMSVPLLASVALAFYEIHSYIQPLDWNSYRIF